MLYRLFLSPVTFSGESEYRSSYDCHCVCFLSCDFVPQLNIELVTENFINHKQLLLIISD